MEPLPASCRVPLLGALAAACLLGAGWPAAVRAAAPNPELDRLIAKLPDPGKWKESPLQNALDPATHDPDLKRVELAMKTGNYAHGLQLMKTVAARYPTHPAIQFLYGHLAVLLKSYSEAERAFRAVAADPKTAAAGWFFLGATQFLENRPRDAAASIRRCLDTKPPAAIAARAWTALAYYDSVSGNHGEAIKASQQGTRLDPKNGMTWVVRGYCESSGKQYDAAINDYQKAISLNNRLPLAYEGLGIAYAQANRPGDAIAPLKIALALTPKNYIAATELGYCYLRSGQPAEGAKASRQAVSTRPDFSKGWDVLGMCYLRLGKKHDAVDAFEKAVNTAPQNTAARAHLEEARRADKVRA